MDIRPLEFSIVVVASDCNPTILNPDFLDRQGIVPSEWGWNLSGPPITTPPFASVSYGSGVRVSVEQNKFQVVQNLLNKHPTDSRIAEIARKYIEILPHVRYTAVGHNFKGLAEHPDAESFLKDRFLVPGAWDSDKHKLQGVTLGFLYYLDDARLNLSFDAATTSDAPGNGPQKTKGIFVQANYHRDCSGYPSDTQVSEHLEKTMNDWAHFSSITKDILG